MLFKISRNPVVKDNPEILQFPEFSSAQDNELKYVFLMYDYKSPYRQQPETIRAKMILAWLSVDATKAQKWIERHATNLKSVYDKFIELQWDDERELYLGYQAQMREWTELLKKKDKSDKENKMVFDFAKDMVDFIENMHKLETLLGERIKKDDSLKAKQKTALEMYMDEKNNEMKS